MSKTEKLRQQHAELVQIVKEVSSYLVPEKASQNAADVSRLLAAFIGKLRVHLAMEDDGLYPTLAKSMDRNVRNIATQFQAEMGNLKPILERYAKKWTTPTAIQSAPQDFCGDTKRLFEALAKRIEKENNELYPMVDKIVA
jgi:hemerythrin-like domain-containing protein